MAGSLRVRSTHRTRPEMNLGTDPTLDRPVPVAGPQVTTRGAAEAAPARHVAGLGPLGTAPRPHVDAHGHLVTTVEGHVTALGHPATVALHYEAAHRHVTAHVPHVTALGPLVGVLGHLVAMPRTVELPPIAAGLAHGPLQTVAHANGAHRHLWKGLLRPPGALGHSRRLHHGAVGLLDLQAKGQGPPALRLSGHASLPRPHLSDQCQRPIERHR